MLAKAALFTARKCLFILKFDGLVSPPIRIHGSLHQVMQVSTSLIYIQFCGSLTSNYLEFSWFSTPNSSLYITRALVIYYMNKPQMGSETPPFSLCDTHFALGGQKIVKFQQC